MRKVLFIVFLFGIWCGQVVFAYDVASIPPIAGLVSKFVGEPVESVVRSGDPHHFQITPSILKLILNADRVWMLNGKLEVENKILKLLQRFSKTKQVIFLGKDLPLLDGDPHQWLSVKNLQTIVKAIDRVVHNEEVVGALLQQLSQLDEKLVLFFSKTATKRLLCLHPAWRYLCYDYGLKMLSLMGKAGGVIPSQLKMVLAVCKSGESFSFIVVESGFEFNKLALIKDMCRIKSIVEFNPLAEDIIYEFEKFVNSLYGIKASNGVKK